MCFNLPPFCSPCSIFLKSQLLCSSVSKLKLLHLICPQCLQLSCGQTEERRRLRSSGPSQAAFSAEDNVKPVHPAELPANNKSDWKRKPLQPCTWCFSFSIISPCSEIVSWCASCSACHENETKNDKRSNDEKRRR